ncbi:aminoglycoside phosphotransferase (APT) family kinase protein [Catenulispora sp. MAP5-51]|uniref:phosphotransferase family protein n=1 Tax=Catenulispora sp. MAP5-51 TaxID=3156298 RepID=UPI003512EC3C
MNEIAEPVLEWVLTRLTLPGHSRATLAGAAGLREGSNPWMLRLDDGRAVVLRVGDPENQEQREGFGVEARLLEIAEQHGVPSARLIAHDPTGAEAGALALLSTVVEGSSRVPEEPTPELLAEYGRATAALRGVPLGALDGMAHKTRPIQSVDFAGARRRQGASDLLLAAEEAVARRPVPEGDPGLVHGDLWLGNTLWVGAGLSGFVDWDCAGIGEPGLDVASIRLDAALMFGEEYAEAVLAGYLTGSGRGRVEDLAYWDVVAALSTPPTMAEFTPVIQDQGRSDLDRPTLERRRDAFLEAAMERLA